MYNSKKDQFISEKKQEFDCLRQREIHRFEEEKLINQAWTT